MIEGDQETSLDADRIRAAGARAVQVNTGAGCHLDAAMVHRALHDLDPPADSLLVIENVGNLVCPALFDLGERAKVVVISVTEGDDKPLKYPHMFRAADLVVVNKTDLLPYVDFDVAALTRAGSFAQPRRRGAAVCRCAPASGSTTGSGGCPPWRREERAVEQPSVREVSERIEALLDDLGASAPPAVMGRVEELLQCVMGLYGAGLERVLETVGQDAVRRLADDELVGNLLVLNDLHPDDVDTRVQRALDQVRPYLGSHAGGVSLSGVDADGVVHLRLEGSCDGCPSSAMTVKSAIEDAILVAAPDVVAVEAEGMVDDAPALLQIGRFEPQRSPRPIARGPAWTSTYRPATMAHVHAADADVLVANLSGTLVAYLDHCPVCLQAASRGSLDGVVLTCACGTSYDVRLAGRAFAGGGEPLRPVPLLPEAGAWKVAVPAGAPT